MAKPASPHILVVGTEKGGAGKSTVSIHLIVAALKSGLSVGAMDLDTRQGSLRRYLDVRATQPNLPMPQVAHILASTARDLDLASEDDEMALDHAMSSLGACDLIVIDTPGSDTALSRHAHARADTLLTPMNDSFVDFAVLGEVEPETYRVLRPSHYAEMVWDARKAKAKSSGQAFDWLVMRNRMSSLDARNKRRVGEGLSNLASRIGFRTTPGFAERVIYRELYPLGLTVLDVRSDDPQHPLSMSHVAARQELRELITALNLPLTLKV
jgi:chromosome partitioning protein